jgi:hypothetical protein
MYEKNSDGSFINLEPMHSSAQTTNTPSEHAQCNSNLDDRSRADFSKLLGTHACSSESAASSSSAAARDELAAVPPPERSSLTSSPYTRPSKKPSVKGPMRSPKRSFPSFSQDIPDYPDDLHAHHGPNSKLVEEELGSRTIAELIQSNRDLRRNLDQVYNELDRQLKMIEALAARPQKPLEAEQPASATAEIRLPAEEKEDSALASIFKAVQDEQANASLSIKERRANLLEKKLESSLKEDRGENYER